MSRFKDFSDLELYMLLQQGMYASLDIKYDIKFSKAEGNVSDNLIKEIAQERRKRSVERVVVKDNENPFTSEYTCKWIGEDENSGENPFL